MIIKRLLYSLLRQAIQPGKIILLYGPRRVGKTTLLQELIAENQSSTLVFSGDKASDRRNLSIEEADHLKSLVGQSSLVIIDEAQKIDRIGTTLKIIVDYLPHIAVIASGSASLDLAQRAEAELVGRNKNFLLYPISFAELSAHFGQIPARDKLERWLIWGSYPEAVTQENTNERSSYLQTLIGTYLYRDMLEMSGIKKSRAIEDLLRLLAFQIGSEVSISELAQNLGINKITVSHYLDLLEKSFVIFNVRGFSRNLRKEISKNSRYYFWDNGVRNALINNFNPLNVRDDVGQLWENFLAIERLKYMAYTSHRANVYFWRTYDQKEIDWIEESGGKISGFEFKYSDSRIRPSIVNNFLSAYHGAQLITITKDNFESFVAPSPPTRSNASTTKARHRDLAHKPVVRKIKIY